MLVGYARTSDPEQVAGFEDQLRVLKTTGCEKIFKEQVSSVIEREALEAALEYVREGDCLVVTKIDRLARSVTNLLEINDRLTKKRVALRILNLGMDTSTPTGHLILTVLGAIAQFEREMMLERQRVGIERAKKEGKFRGRQPLPPATVQQVLDLTKQGVKKAKIARQLRISQASVYRILKNGA